MTLLDMLKDLQNLLIFMLYTEFLNNILNAQLDKPESLTNRLCKRRLPGLRQSDHSNAWHYFHIIGHRGVRVQQLWIPHDSISLLFVV